MNDHDRAFHLAEYAALRAEMLSLIERSNSNRNFMFVSVAAIVAWLLTNGSEMGPWAGLVAAWLPFLLVRYFTGYRADQSDSVGRLADYLRRLEKTLGNEELGWEALSAAKEAKSYRRTRHVFSYANVATVIFALYYMALSGSFGALWNGLAAALARLTPPGG